MSEPTKAALLASDMGQGKTSIAAEFLHQRGIGTYGEAAGVSLEILEDTLLNNI